MSDDWLWSGEGKPDPEVEALAKALAPLRYEGKAPELPRERSRAWWLAIAAPVALAAGALLFLRGPTGWAVDALEGDCGDCRLSEGEWLETDATTRLRLQVADIGTMEVAPDTQLRLASTGPDEHRLELRRGRIDAQVVAPPRLLVVETPSATAVDLGCAYTLIVDDEGAGTLEVTSGVVALETPTRESRVLAGAVAWTRPGTGPSSPWYADAPADLPPALAMLELHGDAAALDAVLAAARPRDTLTLWHLLARVPEADRRRVFERIVELVPGVLPTDEDAVLALDPDALELLWRDLLPTWG